MIVYRSPYHERWINEMKIAYRSDCFKIEKAHLKEELNGGQADSFKRALMNKMDTVATTKSPSLTSRLHSIRIFLFKPRQIKGIIKGDFFFNFIKADIT